MELNILSWRFSDPVSRGRHAVHCTQLKLVGNKRECAAKVSSQLHLAAIKRKGDGRQVSLILLTLRLP